MRKSVTITFAIVCLAAVQVPAQTNTGSTGSRIGGAISSDAEVRTDANQNRAHVGMGVGQGGTNASAAASDNNTVGTAGSGITNSSGMSATNNPTRPNGY